MDGKSLGETPIANLTVPIGPHELLLRHPQFGEQRGQRFGGGDQREEIGPRRAPAERRGQPVGQREILDLGRDAAPVAGGVEAGALFQQVLFNTMSAATKKAVAPFLESGDIQRSVQIAYQARLAENAAKRAQQEPRK